MGKLADSTPDVYPPKLAEILLVEDDHRSVQVTSEMLGFAGCRVVVVGSGEEAVNAVAARPYAMVLMDFRLPGMHGTQATQIIRDTEKRLGQRPMPIVGLTASVMPHEIAQCLASGMNEVLKKPVSLQELNDCVQKWCQQPQTARRLATPQPAYEGAYAGVDDERESRDEPSSSDALEPLAHFHEPVEKSTAGLIPSISNPSDVTRIGAGAGLEKTVSALLELIENLPGEAFERITRLASEVLKAPLAAITLLDDTQQRVKSSVGWHIGVIPRFVSFCSHALDASRDLVVPDTLSDTRFANNPMVLGEPRIRFYAGHPFYSSEGIALGTLCVMDRQPREWTPRESLILKDLAALIDAEVAHGESARASKRAYRQSDRLARDSESRLQATFDQAAVGLALVGLNGAWQRVNRRLCDIVGYSESELLRLTFQDITHPSDLQEDLQLVQQLLEGKINRYCLEKRYVRKDGQTVWINLTVALIRDANDAPDYFISVIEDIQQRKESEDRLASMGHRLEQTVRTRTLELQHANEKLAVSTQQSKLVERSLASREAELRAILHNAPDAYISMDDAGKIVEWNRQSELTFGWKRSEVLGGNTKELIIPAEHQETFDGCMREQSSIDDAPGNRAELVAIRRDGTTFPVELRISIVPSERGQLYCAFLHDITERNSLHESLLMQALRDALTGLPNRRALNERLPQALARAQRSGQPLAVLFLDLDGFKRINDELGHLNGDLLLQQFATRVLGCIRRTDTLARLDGDEFVVLLEGMSDNEDDPMSVATKILNEAAQPFELNGATGVIGVSIGIAVFYPGADVSAEMLLKTADIGMYKAKALGKGRIFQLNVRDLDANELSPQRK